MELVYAFLFTSSGSSRLDCVLGKQHKPFHGYRSIDVHYDPGTVHEMRYIVAGCVDL